ncbi:hypothetical protein C8F01DRAFT_1168636 [Mycena amicta]|nr:hypothetical protein C8F01DRAFT_1168636 [Mycena amicta]
MEAAEELRHSIVALQNIVDTRYVSAAGLVVLLYDHLLTFSDEVDYIWSAPNTVAKVLFLVLRYMVPLFLLGETIMMSGLSYISLSDTVCKVWISTAAYAGLVSVAISNFLVLLRIWTFLPSRHTIVPWSLVFYVAMQLANVGVTTWVVLEMISVLVFEPSVGFCTFSSKPNVVGLWVVGLAYELGVFCVVLWNAAAKQNPHNLESDSRLLHVLVRDGLVYLVSLTALRVANTVIAIIAPVSSLFIIVFFIWASTTLITSRLIINQRRARIAAQNWQRELRRAAGNLNLGSNYEGDMIVPRARMQSLDSLLSR